MDIVRIVSIEIVGICLLQQLLVPSFCRRLMSCCELGGVLSLSLSLGCSNEKYILDR